MNKFDTTYSSILRVHC